MSTNDATSELELQDKGKELDLLTYTIESDFQSCRRLHWWRTERMIVPIEAETEPIFFGKLWHAMAEIRDRLRMTRMDRKDAVAWALAYLSSETAGRVGDPKRRHAWLILSRAMVAYEARFAEDRPRSETGNPTLVDDIWSEDIVHAYGRDAFMRTGDEEIELVAIEHKIVTPLINPETGARSRTWNNGLKIDGLVRRKDTGKLWLLEKKMLSDLGDINRLWTDFQITRYARQVQVEYGEPLEGAIYDVVLRPAIRLKEAYLEPENEWLQRVEEKIAESRDKLTVRLTTRKKDPHQPTTAEYAEEEARVRQLKSMQRVERIAETDAEYSARLDEFYAKPFSIVRVAIPFDQERIEEAEEISWETSQQILDARRRNKWRKNLAHCYHRFGGVCPYITLCRDRLDPEVDENVAMLFRKKKSKNPEFDDDPLDWVTARMGEGFTPEGVIAETAQGEQEITDFGEGLRQALTGGGIGVDPASDPKTGTADIDF